MGGPNNQLFHLSAVPIQKVVVAVNARWEVVEADRHQEAVYQGGQEAQSTEAMVRCLKNRKESTDKTTCTTITRVSSTKRA